MGNHFSPQNAHLERDLGLEFPDTEHFFGFDNKNNICYANSILQALYHTFRFRWNVLGSKPSESVHFFLNSFEILFSQADSIIFHIHNIFNEIYSNKKKTGVISTKKFMSFVKKKNEIFQGDYHQDTQEFLIWLLNAMSEELDKSKKIKENWIKNQFEGMTITETTCLKCKTVSRREEPFLDLSLDLDQNISLNYCLKKYSNVEVLKDSDKFACNNCNVLQTAEKRELVKKLPKTLIFHLKRFKYDEKLKTMIKLYWRIPFPFEFRWKIHDQTENEPCLYNLYAVVVHLGTGYQFGHYLSFIKIHGRWFSFDDENISLIDERMFMSIFGSKSNPACAYMLFYQRSEMENGESA